MPHDLNDLFPHATWHATASSSPDIITIASGQQYLWVPSHQLTEREQLLLHAVKTAQTTTDDWVKFFCHNGPQPQWHGETIQVLQVQFTHETPSDVKLWADTLQQALPFANHISFYQPQTAWVLCHQFPLTQDEIDGLFATLDDDFSVKTQRFIGLQWPIHQPNLATLFAEERRMFQLGGRSVSSQAITYFTQHARSESPVLHTLAEAIKDDHDLIHAMWTTQGNVTQAAQVLYLHRNSLQYRLERFHEQTGFSLKQMDDLFLCYIASHTSA